MRLAEGSIAPSLCIENDVGVSIDDSWARRIDRVSATLVILAALD
jgi:hypothetical protein